MILFYDAVKRQAAIATITPQACTTTKSYPALSFGSWSHLVAHNGLVLFYSQNTGAAAIGVLSGTALTTTQSYDEGQFGRWTHLVSTSAGVLCYNADSGAAAIGAMKTSVFTTTGSLKTGSLERWTHIVANGATVLFYNRFTCGGAIATVTPTGMQTITSYAPGAFGSWTHVVNNGPTILFYNRDTRGGAIGTLTADSFQTHQVYAPDSFGRWSHIVADGQTILFYNANNTQAAIGILSTQALTSTMTYQPGLFSAWTHIAGSSACGPEPEELRVAVLLARWNPPGATSTVQPRSFYENYFFNLAYQYGIGRYWLLESGGQLRLSGSVSDWYTLSKAPSDPSTKNNRTALAKQAVADAQSAGWHPGNAQLLVVVLACDAAAGVDGGALGAPLNVDGQERYCAVLHGDSANYIRTNPDNVLRSNFRADFNEHEVGHLIGDVYQFNHAFGPQGRYDHPYCIMAAMTYGLHGSSYQVNAVYDMWTPHATRGPEEQTFGPGLAGTTRAACGWARRYRLSANQLQQGADLIIAQLGDLGSSLPQVIECPAHLSDGTATTYTIEFRSPLGEHDQGYADAAVVVAAREHAQSVNDYGLRSSTFVQRQLIVSGGSLPSITVLGVLRATVLQVGPTESNAFRKGPGWIRVHVSVDPT